MANTERRVALTVVVSVVGSVIGIAGAGHAYLREWGRAFAWFSLVLGAGLVLTASFADPETATLSTLPLRVTGPILLLLTLNTVDAYFVARRSQSTNVVAADPTDEDGPSVTCPSCGRDFDPDLSFCPWCADSRDGERVEDRE
ncbi:zinc ribbon domain-containing protein [Haloplanus aerogenes]|uniref:Zinc ribbon domain-containing protein n=1 Tax=Haloplanus aerogenes TaxID=660522 RepID=A0A3M0CXL9_9EURY|nr:zinc ribbon domain-containing protein [Haloplanus aerogenes]AZH24930.1 zinc ribbon domain-containing protein [Haloplanus aerogenes]RMB13858.1 hypothetical protein ATH50_2300 [Haloplanus aerogenes]